MPTPSPLELPWIHRGWVNKGHNEKSKILLSTHALVNDSYTRYVFDNIPKIVEKLSFLFLVTY